VNFEQILEVYMIAENTTFDPAIIIDLRYFFEAGQAKAQKDALKEILELNKKVKQLKRSIRDSDLVMDSNINSCNRRLANALTAEDLRRFFRKQPNVLDILIARDEIVYIDHDEGDDRINTGEICSYEDAIHYFKQGGKK